MRFKKEQVSLFLREVQGFKEGSSRIEVESLGPAVGGAMEFPFSRPPFPHP